MRKCFAECLGGNAISERSTEPQIPPVSQRPLSDIEEDDQERSRGQLKSILKKSPTDSLSGFCSPTPVRRQRFQENSPSDVQSSTYVVVKPSERRHGACGLSQKGAHEPAGFCPYFPLGAEGFSDGVPLQHRRTPFIGLWPGRPGAYTGRHVRFQRNQETHQRLFDHGQFWGQSDTGGPLRSNVIQQPYDGRQNHPQSFRSQFPRRFLTESLWRLKTSSASQQPKARQKSIWRQGASSQNQLNGSPSKRPKRTHSFWQASGEHDDLVGGHRGAHHSLGPGPSRHQPLDLVNNETFCNPWRRQQRHLRTNRLPVHSSFVLSYDGGHQGLFLNPWFDQECHQRPDGKHYRDQSGELPGANSRYFNNNFLQHRVRRFKPYPVERFPPQQPRDVTRSKNILAPNEQKERHRKYQPVRHVQFLKEQQHGGLNPRQSNYRTLKLRDISPSRSNHGRFVLRTSQRQESIRHRQSPHPANQSARLADKHHHREVLSSSPVLQNNKTHPDYKHQLQQRSAGHWRTVGDIPSDSGRRKGITSRQVGREPFPSASCSTENPRRTTFSVLIPSPAKSPREITAIPSAVLLTTTYSEDSSGPTAVSSTAASRVKQANRQVDVTVTSPRQVSNRASGSSRTAQRGSSGCITSCQEQAPPRSSSSWARLARKQDTDRKREAFYEMLASRYPQYADKITGLSAYHHRPPTPTERSSRPREPQRRRTVVPSLTHYNGRSLDYDDPGTMSDIELSSFQRGGYARASMPIVRSASTSLERPIGLVFLVYRNETKKALLPNEITSLDTVRALFVRAFPEKLSMEILDSPKQKIYILEPTTSIFFQLEDLRDIKDRTVLKIHECDSNEPQHVRYQIEIRGRATHPLRPASHQGIVRETGPQFREELAKTQSLPVSASQNYSEALHKERLQWEMEQDYIQEQQRRSRSRSLTPEPAERPRSLSAGPPRGRYSHTTESLPTPDRGLAHLNPIPENPRLLANGFRQAAVNGSHYDMGGHPHGHPHAGHPPPPHPGRVISPTPAAYDSVFSSGGYPNPQAYISHSTRAPTAQGPLQATGPPPPPDMRGNNRGGPPHRQSLPFAGMSNPMYESFPQQRTQPYRTTPERDVLPPRPQSAAPNDVGRMERMEAQIASLAAWVHQVQVSPVEAPSGRRNSNRSTSSGQSEGTDTYPASSGSKQIEDSSSSSLPGLSDIPNACSQSPVVTLDMREKINDVRCRMKELRVELQGLRRMEQLNQEAMKDVFSDTLTKIKKVIDAVPGADDQVVRQQRLEVNSLAEAYRQDKAKVEKELSDLESGVEELKQDVLARKCRVNITDVEGLALVLSNITKSLADLKARYPKVNESLRKVMAGEMEIVVKEEKFIKEEPQNIEAALKRCKKLTSTLYTLKRLATVQDTRPLQVPPLALECKEVGEEEKMAILENIRAMVPDHETRLYNLEAADASRERKKKIVTQQESLKFTKSLQTASKALRPSEPGATASAAQKEEAVTFREKDSKKSMGESDSWRSEPPIIPAKPARLLLTRELKHCDTPPSSPRAPMKHTVTVTSQISEDGENETESKAGGCSSARSVFFGSLESPTNEHSDEDRAFIETSPTITISVTTSAGFSQCKPVSTMYYQAPTSSTRRTSSSSSYQSSIDVEDADSVKRVPPPPPPRKSSARYPYGIGPLSPQSPSEGCRSPGGAFMQRQSSGEQSPDKVKQGGTSVYKGHGPLTPTTTASISGPLSSTPKPPTPQKPPSLSKLYKAQAVGGRRPNLQHQRVGADRMFTTFIPPVPAEIVTNSQDPLDEGDLSGSESTGSTTSLDSQKGLAALVRTNSTPLPRGPKPHPPQRCSSLGSRDSRSQDRELTGTTHMVEVKKPLVVGTMTVQLNGLDGARGSGHKT